MVLPLTLLNTAQSQPMLVELKNGETYNGHLVNCDHFMNLTLRGVIQTSPDGDKFLRLPECYVRGSSIKFLRLPEQIIDMVKEDVAKNRAANNRGRGGARGSSNRGNSSRGGFNRGGGGQRGGGGGGGRGGRGGGSRN